jgi:hypothetical protein
MRVQSAIDATWRLQVAIGLAIDAAVCQGGFTPTRNNMPGDLDHLADCLLSARTALAIEQAPWPWLYTSVGLTHAHRGRLADALECWRNAAPMLATISGRQLEAECPELTLTGPPR